MSILIKGMKMPRNCYICPFFKQVEYWNKNDEVDILSKCKRTGECTWGSVNGYLPNCPLVPVPPHGNLVDAREVSRKVRKFGFPESDYTRDEIAAWFENGDFPTIIPADPAEEDEQGEKDE